MKMRRVKQQAGQAMVESLMLLTLLASLILLIGKVITPLHEQQLSRIESARMALWKWQADKQVEKQSDYAFAHRANTVLAPLKALTGFTLAQDNLRHVTSSERTVAMARITDPWSPYVVEDLVGRPAQLTPFSRMQTLGLNRVQEVISWLHFTEEFAPDSLRFGYVNDEATPGELACEDTMRC